MTPLLLAALLALTPRLAVSTRASVGTAPLSLYVTVRMEPHAEDRWLEIEADGTAFYRMSGEQLEGAGSARVRQILFRELPEGCYRFMATVLSGEPPEGRVLAYAESSRLAVLGMGMEGNPCEA